MTLPVSKPRRLPLLARDEHPSDKIDPVDDRKHQSDLSFSMASHAFTRCGEWMTRGRGGVKNRALRADVVLLSIVPQFLPTKRPNAAWVGKQHGVSRQRVSDLWREFAIYIGPYIQFRGQHFLNGRNSRGRDNRRHPSERRANERISQESEP
jgi:hypothetical protein